MLHYLFSRLASLSTTAQIVLLLPLALDWLGPPSFLVCSLLLLLCQLGYSTARLALKNTAGAPLVLVLGLIGPFVPALCALGTVYLYLHPASADGTSASGSEGWAFSRYLVGTAMPRAYAASLRVVSPFFSVLEGFATLLCAQVVGRMSKGFVESADDREEGIEWRRLGLLVGAALLYCAGFYWLVKAYPLTDPITASGLHPILLGAALTTVLFLTFIGFARRRATVVETALVFLYVVYSAWMSGRESKMQPHAFESGWLTSGWGKSKALPAELSSSHTSSGLSALSLGSDGAQPIVALARYLAIVLAGALGLDLEAWIGSGQGLSARGDVTSLAMSIAGHSTESIRKIGLSLPPALLISLCYRLLVLHLAARIIPAIRRASAGWQDGAYDEPSEKEGFWDGRRLGEEAPSVRVTTILLSYRRAILITVYTHLLLLDNGSQVWWRWVNIFLFMGVWALELLFEDDFDDDTESIKGY